jgi:signal transduction histidine kinase
MMHLYRLLLLSCMLCGQVVAFAIPVVDDSILGNGTNIGNFVEYHIDSTTKAGIEDILEASPEQWTRHTGEKISLGFRKDAVWLRFSLPAGDEARRWWFTINYPLLNELDLYQLDGNRVIRHQRGGTAATPDDKPMLSIRALFVVETMANRSSDFYLRVRSDSSLVLPLQFHTPVSLLDALVLDAQKHGLFFGALLVLICYHLIMLILFRDRSYLLYIGLNTALTLALALLSGTANRYFFATADESSLRIVPLSIVLAMWMGMMLTREFLGTARQLPRLDTAMQALSSLALAPAVITLVFGYYPGIIAVSLLIPPLVGMMFFASARAVKAGFAPARYFLTGWGFMVAGSALYAGRALGWVHDNAWTAQSLHFGVGVLMGLVALSLTARFRLFMDEEAAQRRQTMEEIRLSNQRLEEEVAKRTRELNDETTQLQATEKALAVQDRRFASGVMSAGVAHEINNPNNFVNAGAQLYQAKLQSFRNMVFDLLDGDTSSEIYAQFDKRLSLLEKRVESVADASRHISDIVNHFRSAAKADESEIVAVSIVERLRATVDTIRAGLEARLQIDIDFGDSPEILCNAGEIVQAFVTLLNAYAEYTTEGERQGVVLGSICDGQRLKLYVRPLLPCMGIRERLGWLDAVMSKQAASVEWEIDGGLILILPVSR